MKSISKRKKIEFFLLPIFLGVLYFFTSNIDAVVLFTFGYIWNWVCSIELDEMYSEKRYKFSLLRLVLTVQQTFLKPFNKFPEILKRVIRIFPAGVFWFLILFIYDSQMPIWAPFLGSLVFELTSLEVLVVSKEKDRS